MKQTELKAIYKEVFQSTAGKRVREDLVRIANQSRIDQDNPNPYAAIFKIAQQSLLKRIDNMLEETKDPNHNIIERH